MEIELRVSAMLDILAQTTTPAPPPPPQQGMLSLDTIFWASVLAIFLITIVSAILRRLAKDKALKLLHNYHVTFFSERRATVWGDVMVSSQGIELLFDQSYTTHRGIVKSSALLYDDEFTTFCALTRTVHGLTDREKRKREAQIQRTFNPGALRRMRRWLRNLLNTLRDAIAKTMSLLIGRMTGGMGAAVALQAGDINALTGTVVGLAANAYEPLLERNIGKAVVIEIALPPPPGPPPPNWIPEIVEFPGYLVDYTQRFVAVFNVDHTPVEEIKIKLEAGKAAEPDLADLKITATGEHVTIQCMGRDAFVLKQLCFDNKQTDLGIAMLPGTTIRLGGLTQAGVLSVERTRKVDLVVPRTRARVRFGSVGVKGGERRGGGWMGVAPVEEPGEESNEQGRKGPSLWERLTAGARGKE